MAFPEVRLITGDPPGTSPIRYVNPQSSCAARFVAFVEDAAAGLEACGYAWPMSLQEAKAWKSQNEATGEPLCVRPRSIYQGSI